MVGSQAPRPDPKREGGRAGTGGDLPPAPHLDTALDTDPGHRLTACLPPELVISNGSRDNTTPAAHRLVFPHDDTLQRRAPS